MIPLWFKLAYTAFVLYVAVVWLKHYGWKNFLWFSDIAFLGAVPAMWLENAVLSSVLAVAVLLPEILWNVDYVGRLVLRRRITGLTDYMFEPERPLLLRGLSLFHVPLPLVLVWLLVAYGYDASVGLPGAIVLAAIVLPLSRAVSAPDKNINWVYGLGRVQTRLPAWAYLLVLFAGFVACVFVPTDLVLRRFIG
ncbi:MAG: hypothetical protein U1F09_01605 [Steroidobacteraceae bacterium]